MFDCIRVIATFYTLKFDKKGFEKGNLAHVYSLITQYSSSPSYNRKHVQNESC